MSKKLNSLEELAKIKFGNLAPDPDPLPDSEPEFMAQDLEAHFHHFVPENQSYYQHTYEGADDMPAHIKSSTIGCQLSIPIDNGQLQLGCWQGIYLCEHRNHAGSRQIVATIQGQSH